jgi:hypothetical protein
VTVAVESGAIGRGAATKVHAPLVQIEPTSHALPQTPQLALDASVSVSHPLAGLPSQLPNPGLQTATAQAPKAQPDVACANEQL